MDFIFFSFQNYQIHYPCFYVLLWDPAAGHVTKFVPCSSSCSSPFWVRSRLHPVTPQAGRRRLLLLASSWKLLCWSGVLVDGGDCLDCQQQEELPLHHPPPPPPPAATDRIEKAIYPARRLIWVFFTSLSLRGLWMDSVDVVKVLSLCWLPPVMVDSAGFFYCFLKNISGNTYFNVFMFLFPSLVDCIILSPGEKVGKVPV